jgi:hypothetical protein
MSGRESGRSIIKTSLESLPVEVKDRLSTLAKDPRSGWPARNGRACEKLDAMPPAVLCDGREFQYEKLIAALGTHYESRGVNRGETMRTPGKEDGKSGKISIR